MQGVQVLSLVREIRSHMFCGQKIKKLNGKQYCNTFKKIIQMSHIKKISEKIIFHILVDGEKLSSTFNFQRAISYLLPHDTDLLFCKQEQWLPGTAISPHSREALQISFIIHSTIATIPVWMSIAVPRDGEMGRDK